MRKNPSKKQFAKMLEKLFQEQYELQLTQNTKRGLKQAKLKKSPKRP